MHLADITTTRQAMCLNVRRPYRLRLPGKEGGRGFQWLKCDMHGNANGPMRNATSTMIAFILRHWLEILVCFFDERQQQR